MALTINKRAASSGKTIHERQRRRRTTRRVFIAIFVLLVFCIVAAIIYVWYMGQHPLEATQTVVNTAPLAPKLKAPSYDPNAPVGIVQQTFTGAIAAGGNAMISIKTQPKAACQIAVKVNKETLPDTGLVPKIADEFGMVDWSWTVPKNVLPGKWPVEITCANDLKKSAYFKVELEVSR